MILYIDTFIITQYEAPEAAAMSRHTMTSVLFVNFSPLTGIIQFGD